MSNDVGDKLMRPVNMGLVLLVLLTLAVLVPVNVFAADVEERAVLALPVWVRVLAPQPVDNTSPFM